MQLCGKFVWLLLLALAGTACSRPEGPPIGSQINFDNVCNALRPNPLSVHGAGSSGTGGYSLGITPPMMLITNGFTYEANTTYTSKI